MSFYVLAIWFWAAVAALGVLAPVVAFALMSAADSLRSWLSSVQGDEPAISSQHGPVSCP